MKEYSWPSINHSFLSPNGYISKRVRKEYMTKFARKLFPDNGECLRPKCTQPTEAERIQRRIIDLANRGMNTRAFRKEAAKLKLKLKEVRCIALRIKTNAKVALW